MRITGGFVLMALAGVPASSAAQSLGLDPDHDLPVWMRTWSPLGPRADLARRLPGARTATSPSLYGAPRVGAFWTAGNPAGLLDGVPDTRTDFTATWSRQHGDYRRPLDPGAAQLLQAAVQSWKRFAPTFAMLGRVSYDQEQLDPGTRSDFTEAFPSSAFVSTDTSGAPVRRTRAALEGAAAWRFSEWDLGLSAGYRSGDNLSTVSELIRHTRMAMPGLAAGASRRLGPVTLGFYGRFRYAAETVELTQRLGSGTVYELTGYREVPPIYLSSPYYRRREEDTWSVGGSLSGQTGSWRWAGYGEGDWLGERLWRQQQDNPAQDRWDASGWTAGGAVQRPLGPRWLFTVHARAAGLSGTATLAGDSSGTIFTADESTVQGEAELRLLPGERGWSGTMTLGLSFDSRTRSDSATQIVTDVSATTTSVGIELGRRIGRRLVVNLGGVLAIYGPTSALPDPARRGKVYQYYFAPEFALYGSRAHPTALSLLLRYRLPSGVAFWIAGRTEQLSSAETVFIPSAPQGSRSATSLVTGVTVGPH